jgi:hypothetical protein
MNRIGTLLLENGGWIIEDTQYQVLAYRRQCGTAIFNVPYLLTESGCILGRAITARGADAPTRLSLPRWETDDLLKDMVGHLNKAGISARIGD